MSAQATEAETVAADPATLTEKQRLLLTLLYETARDKGYQPSMRELFAPLEVVSPNGVTCHLRALQRKGWLSLRETDGKRHGTQSRSIRILRRPDGQPFDGFADKP